MKTTKPTNALSFNNWARYVKAESSRMKYGQRSSLLNAKEKNPK